MLSLGSHGLAQASAERPGTIESAIAQLDVALQYTPDNPLIYRRLAEAALRQGRLGDAVVALETAYTLQPNSRLVLNDFIHTSLMAGDTDRARRLLEEKLGDGSDLTLVGDLLFQSGKWAEALDVYRALGSQGTPPAALANLRAGVVAALLGDDAQAQELLRASGAPEPALIVDSVRSGAVFGEPNPWSALLVNGQQQSFYNSPLHAFYGSGWYGPEPHIGRWARSPAELLVYSSVARTVELDLRLSLLVDPNSANGFGEEDELRATVNGGEAVRTVVRTSEPALLTLDLPAGWSNVTLALAAGNIRPDQQIPGSTDPRELSISVLRIDLKTP